MFTSFLLIQGFFGKVMKGKLRENQREVAVKVCTSSEESQRFKREIQLMMISDHPNIVQFIGSVKGNIELLIISNHPNMGLVRTKPKMEFCIEQA